MKPAAHSRSKHIHLMLDMRDPLSMTLFRPALDNGMASRLAELQP